jgi:hypothetical protein
MTANSVRSRIREIVRTRIEDEDEISLPNLTDALVTLLRGDEPFMEEFIRISLRSEVYAQVSAAVAGSRNLVLFGDTAMSEDAIEKRSDAFASRFLGWFEHSGERHVRLMDMTKEDLLASASERRKRGNREYVIAELWTQLAGKLKKGQRVEERFTAEEIEAMYSRIESATEGVAA